MSPVEPDSGPSMPTCAIDNGGCDPNADCFEAPEGRVCQCRQGFTGDGLTCIVPWEPIATIPDRVFYNGFGAFAIGSGSRIFFFPESNDPPPSSFFLSYDILSGEVREEALPPPEVNDFCACGAGQVLVALDDYLYQFGNYGTRYHTTLQTWEELFYPPERARGEAAGAALGQRAYTFGGRDNARSVQYFDVTLLDWVDLGPTLPWDLDQGAAVAVEPNLIYVFGGRVDGVANRAAVYDAEANAWQPLPDMPDQLYANRGSGLASGRPFVVSYETLYSFDPSNGTWSSIPMPMAPYSYATTVIGEVYVVSSVDGQVEIHRLVN
ncbi:MAG TPA: EGF domain-containing protein [Haliangium sp.]|nr:EGF domain-containing protein [Haliangium sp.]